MCLARPNLPTMQRKFLLHLHMQSTIHRSEGEQKSRVRESRGAFGHQKKPNNVRTKSSQEPYAAMEMGHAAQGGKKCGRLPW